MAFEIMIEWDGKVLLDKAGKIEPALQAGLPDVLNLCGVQLLGLSRLDYVAKSRGGRGEDGVKWRPLHPDTIARKMRKNRKSRGAKKKKTKTGKERPTVGMVPIGIDRGLQIQSVVPGSRVLQAEAGPIEPTDGGYGVILGYKMKYSKYFDVIRPLLPNGDLPVSWQNRLERTLQKFGYRVLKESGLTDVVDDQE